MPKEKAPIMVKFTKNVSEINSLSSESELGEVPGWPQGTLVGGAERKEDASEHIMMRSCP